MRQSFADGQLFFLQALSLLPREHSSRSLAIPLRASLDFDAIEQFSVSNCPSESMTESSSKPHGRSHENSSPAASRWTRSLVSVALVLPFVLVATAWGFGNRLPAERRLHHEAVVTASPAEIVALLRDFDRQPSWWPRVERIEPLEGRDGVRQIFTDGRSAHLATVANADHEVLWTISDPAGPYRGTWRFAIRQETQGSRVELVEESRLGNAFARLLVAWRGGGGGMAEDCLNALTAWPLAATGD